MDLAFQWSHAQSLYNMSVLELSECNISGGVLSAMVDYSKSSHEANLSVLLVFILVTAATRLVQIQSKRKIRLPGPQPFPLVGNAHLLIGDSSKLIYKISELLEQYNGLMALWIGPKLHVFVSKPEHLEVFCTSPKLVDKSDHYKFVKPLLGESIFATNGASWKQGRKLLMPSLKPMFLKHLMPSFNYHTSELIKKIEKECGRGTFDVFNYVRDSSYAMIFETVLGRRIEVDVDCLKESEETMDIIYQRVLKLWLQWDPLFYFLPIGRRLKNSTLRLNSYNAGQIEISIEKLAKQEISAGAEGQLLVDHLSKKIGDTNFNLMREHIQTMLVTGYDTTAGTMGFILMMLGMHQEIQEKVFKEIQQVSASIDYRDLESEDLQQLQYLDQVIKETLRLFPVGPLIFRKASEDVKIGNVIVPCGATVACAMLSTHRDPSIFPDPLTFNPDNFLPERSASRHPYSYIPFSAGSRGCIGTKYGMMSMKVIISQLVANYKIFCDMKMNEIRLKPEITMKIEGGFLIRIEKRLPLS